MLLIFLFKQHLTIILSGGIMLKNKKLEKFLFLPFLSFLMISSMLFATQLRSIESIITASTAILYALLNNHLFDIL